MSIKLENTEVMGWEAAIRGMRLVTLNKYNHMEANHEKVQNADCVNLESDSDGRMLKDIDKFIERYGG